MPAKLTVWSTESSNTEDDLDLEPDYPTYESERNDVRIFKHVSLQITGQVYEAALQGNTILTRSLLKAGHSILGDGQPEQPVNAAVTSGSIATVVVLLEQMKNTLVKPFLSRTSVETAACKGYSEILCMLLDSNWVELDGLAIDSALLLATRNGHADVIKVLLFHGADPTWRGSTYQASALETAIQCQLQEILELFIMDAFVDRGMKYTHLTNRELCSFLDIVDSSSASQTETHNPAHVGQQHGYRTRVHGRFLRRQRSATMVPGYSTRWRKGEDDTTLKLLEVLNQYDPFPGKCLRLWE